MIRIFPSVLAADVLRMGDEIARMLTAGADGLHVDIMDAHFVPNLSYSPALVAAIRARFPDAWQDVHLMMSRPGEYVGRFAQAGASAITIHAEAEGDISAILKEIRALGCRTGVSVKPGTPVERVRGLLPLCDQVLVMTVEPGFGGQKFMTDMMAKARALRAWGWQGHIQVDGGVNARTAAECVAAGVDTLVMGTALLKAPDPAAVIAACRALEDKA